MAGRLIVFFVFMGLAALAATILTAFAVPIAQSDHPAGLETLLADPLLLVKEKKCSFGCLGCEKKKVCLVWKHNDLCTDHSTSDMSCCKYWFWKKQCDCSPSHCPNGGCICQDKSCKTKACCDQKGSLWLC